MSNVIGVLEQLGQNAELNAALKDGSLAIAGDFANAILERDEARIREIAGDTSFMCCILAPEKREDDDEQEPQKDDDEIRALRMNAAA